MIRFYKIRDVKSPARNAGADMGFDYFVPNYSEEFCNELKEVNKYSDYPEEMVKALNLNSGSLLSITENGIDIPPNSQVRIPSGIKTRFPENIGLVYTDKSGTALKKHLIVTSKAIDHSYTGEANIVMTNVGRFPVHVNYGEKIVQAVPYLIDYKEHTIDSTETMTEEAFYEGFETTRNANGFGSTGI